MPPTAPAPGETLGAVVSENPARAAVLDAAGIDYCCGGRRSLEEACRDSGVALDGVLAALVDADAMGGDGERDWRGAGLGELCDHIVESHHAFLERELPRLGALAAKVAGVHGQRHPELAEVNEAFESLAGELHVHLMKEEQMLFPAVRMLEESEDGMPFEGTVAAPIRCMLGEHEDAGDALEQIRTLTGGFAVPDDACASYTALYAGLADLDRDLRMHIHEENNVLFPAALTRESQLR